MNHTMPDSMLWLQMILNVLIFLTGTVIIFDLWFSLDWTIEAKVAILGLLEGLCISKGYVGYELWVFKTAYEGPQEMTLYLLLNTQMAVCGVIGCYIALRRNERG